MELYIHPKVVEGLCPGRDLFQLVEEMDLDGICVMSSRAPSRSESREQFYVDQWGTRFGRTAEAYHPIEGPIKAEADLESYVPPDPYDEATRTYGQCPLDMAALS